MEFPFTEATLSEAEKRPMFQYNESSDMRLALLNLRLVTGALDVCAVNISALLMMPSHVHAIGLLGFQLTEPSCSLLAGRRR